MVRRARTGTGMPAGVSPAVVLMLLTGVEPGLPEDHPRHDPRAWGIKGRWAWAFTGAEDVLEDAWAAHGVTLTADARRAGFRPFWSLAEGQEWTPEEARAERAWRDAFLAVHGRCGNVSPPADIVLP